MSLSDSWQAFLDACAEKGLPFRDWAYALEEKGVPSLPVFAFALILILGLLFFVVAPSVPGVGPQNGKLRVSVSSLGGGEVGDEPVVWITNAKTGDKQKKAVSNGVALFDDLPAGEYQVSIVSNTLLFTPSVQIKSVEGGKTASLSFEGSSASADLVALYVTIRGADSAQIVLEYEGGAPIDSAIGSNAVFHVNKNKNYVVSASQEGYSTVQQTVAVASSNEQVTLTLVKNGEQREAKLHVGVFDDAGAYGNPIENASVRVIEAKTGRTLFASLRTAQDGSCDAEPVPFGATLNVIASAAGFESKTESVNASDDTTNVQIRLTRAAAAENTTITVVDEAGAAVAAPLVRIFDSRDSLRSENAPVEGVLQIDASAFGGLAGLYATVYKPGYLPSVLYSLRKGTNKVVLREATKQNSGAARVTVTDKNGLPAGQANVNLLDSSKKQFGLPGSVTGEDGVTVFDGVPAGGVIAVAAKGGRSAQSAVTQVPAGGEAEIAVSFPAVKTRFEALVTDAATRKPVAGATVKLAAGSSASCTTDAAGKCGFEVVESDAATALVTANGYDDFQSSEFALTPGIKNKREFALVARETAAGKIAFIGFFDENGKRASAFKPLATYTARFALSGSATRRAIAHVRAGDAAKDLAEEPLELVSYSAGGSRVTRGVSYDEVVARQQNAAETAAKTTASASASSSAAKKNEVVVAVYDYGFVPQDVQSVEGARVIFKNLGATQHTVVFDQGFEGGAGSSSNVLQPNQTFIVTPPRSGSWSFRCGLHPQEIGTLNVVPNTQGAQSEAKKAVDGNLAGSEATEFKWVEFSFEPFKGRREVSVSFKTKQRVGEKAWLEYRAAFYDENGKAVLREPEDAAAGESKPEALADAKKTPALAIKFAGVCDKGVCLEYWFEQDGVRSSADETFTAELGKTFRLGFNALKEDEAGGAAGAVTLKLKTPLSAAAGGALALKQAALGARIAGSMAAAAGEANASELAIVLRDAESTGFFEVEAKRLSNDAALQLAALDVKKSVLLEENAFLRVAADGVPKLRVAVKPAALTALEEKTVSFTVQNAFGTAIADARVSLEPADESSEMLASALEADENSADARRGEYRITRVKPAGAGALKWRVSSEGYAEASGVIAVKPPSEAFTLAPEAVKLVLRESDDSATAKITVKNKVSNDLRVTASSEFSKPSDYIAVGVSPDSLSLRGGETKEFVVTASLSAGVPLVSSDKETLSAKALGTLHFVASTGDAAGSGFRGTFGESKDVEFQVDASVAQKKISDLWSVDKNAVELELQAPSQGGQATSTASSEEASENEISEGESVFGLPAEAERITVENKGGVPLIINQEIDLDGVSVDPLSAVLAPGESADFVLTPLLPDSLPACLASDEKNEGSITFYGSNSGVSSQKKVALKKTIKASESCEPEDAVSLTLPVPITIEIPSSAAAKENVDGSRALILGGGEVIWFDAGSSVDSRSITLPLNTRMKVARSRASLTQQGVTLALPAQTIVEIPDDADVAQQGGALVVSAGNALIYLPAGIPLSQYQNQRSAVVPANAQMRFERAPLADILGMLPTGGISLNLPVEETLILPTSARIVKHSSAQSNVPLGGFGFGGASSSAYSGYAALSRYQNVDSIVLPDGLRIAFGGDARVERTPAAVIVVIPANGQFVVPPHFVIPLKAAGSTNPAMQPQSEFSAVYEAFALAMPFLSLPGIPKDAKLIPDAKQGLYSYRLSDESAVQFKFDPRTAATQVGTVTQVRVPPMAPVSFLKGASATAIEDPTQVCAAPEVFAADEDVLLDFPTGTVFTKGSVKAVTHGCTSDSKIRVYSQKESDLVLYESPASKRVVVEGGKLETDGATESENTVKTTAGKKISFYYCEKDDDGKKISDELKQASITLLGATTLVLPASAKPSAGLTEIKLGGYKKIKLVGGMKNVTLSATNKISIEFGTGADAMIAKQKEAFERGESRSVYLPPRSVIKYVPYCAKSASGSLEIRVGAAPLAFDPAALEFDKLSNANPKQNKEICIKNLGLETVGIKSLSVEPKSGSELMSEALPVDAEHMHFAEQQKYGGVHTGNIPGGEKCARYVFTAVVPPSVLDANECIPEGFEANLTGDVLFHAVLENGRQTEPVRLPAKIEISGADMKERCAGFIAPENANGLLNAGAAEVGPDQRAIYFKGVGGAHKQFLTLKNNWREDVVVRVIKDARLANCVSPSGEALEGKQIKSGTAVLYTCTSVARGQGQILLNFTSIEGGGKWYQEFPVEVTVFQPDSSVAALYSHSPAGKVFVGENTLKGLGGTEEQNAAGGAGAGGAGAQGGAARTSSAPEFESCLYFTDPAPAAPPATPAAPSSSSATSSSSLTSSSTPELPKAATSFSLCELRYCAGVDAVQTLDSFIADTAALAITENQNEKMYEKIRTRLGQGRAWQKVFVLHLTNTVMTSEQLVTQINVNVKKRSEELKKQGFNRGIVFDDRATAGKFTGCGIYAITAKLDAGGGGGAASTKPYAERVKDYALNLEFEKLGGCEETLANLPLLMSPDDVDFYSGNEIEPDPGNVVNIFKKWLHLQKALLGRYYATQNAFDVAQAGAFSLALHGIQRGAVTNQGRTAVVGVYPSAYYENIGQCWSNLVGPIRTLVISQVAITTILVGISIVFPNPQTIKAAIQFGLSLLKTIPACGISFLAGALKKDGSACASLEFCVHLAVINFFDALFNAAIGMGGGIRAGAGPTAGTPFSGGLGTRFNSRRGTFATNSKQIWGGAWKDLWQDAAGYALMTGGAAFFNKENDPTLVYFGGKALRILFGALTAPKKAPAAQGGTQQGQPGQPNAPGGANPQTPGGTTPTGTGLGGFPQGTQFFMSPNGQLYAQYPGGQLYGFGANGQFALVSGGLPAGVQAVPGGLFGGRVGGAGGAGGASQVNNFIIDNRGGVFKMGDFSPNSISSSISSTSLRVGGETTTAASSGVTAALSDEFYSGYTVTATHPSSFYPGTTTPPSTFYPGTQTTPPTFYQESWSELSFADAAADANAVAGANTAAAGAATQKKPSILQQYGPIAGTVALGGGTMAIGAVKKTGVGKIILEQLPGLIGGGAAAILLFNVKGRPVRAEFSNAFAAHVLAFHYNPNGVPSSRAYCFLSDDEKTSFGMTKHCFKNDNELGELEIEKQDNVCPAANKACLYVLRSPSVQNTPQAEVRGVKGYTVFLVVNKDAKTQRSSFKTKEVFESVFQPEIPPVAAGDAAGLFIGLVNSLGSPTQDADMEVIKAQVNEIQSASSATTKQMEDDQKKAAAELAAKR